MSENEPPKNLLLEAFKSGFTLAVPAFIAIVMYLVMFTAFIATCASPLIVHFYYPDLLSKPLAGVLTALLTIFLVILWIAVSEHYRELKDQEKAKEAYREMQELERSGLSFDEYLLKIRDSKLEGW